MIKTCDIADISQKLVSTIHNTLLFYPKPAQHISFISLKALSTSEAKIKVLLEDYETTTVLNQQYIKIPYENIILKDVQFVQRIIQKIMHQYHQQPLDDHLETEVLVHFVKRFIRINYSTQTQAKAFTYQFLSNLAHWQFFSHDVYLFKQMLFELDCDFWMAFADMHKICMEKKQSFTQMYVQLIKQSFANFSPEKQDLLVVQLQQAKPQHIPALLLHSFVVQRRRAYQTSCLILEVLKKEEVQKDITRSAFAQFCSIMQIKLNSAQQSLYFQLFSTKQLMSQREFDNFFVSYQLAKFCVLNEEIVQEASSPHLKKLMIQTGCVFENLKEVIQQITCVINMHIQIDTSNELDRFAIKIDTEYQLAKEQIEIFDYQSAVTHLKNIIVLIIDAMLLMKPDCCVVAVSGAVSALRLYFQVQ
ncbi:Conserved_hypothetical protein [Hexamita inflata]|uniref:Uncharacterized protein n=1 Tax=Hexamita inflata TaxID=28002 RepID=A0AA86UAK0_9EUKA|nr:Conserved hypothetical protein [Hexamita inflata]